MRIKVKLTPSVWLQIAADVCDRLDSNALGCSHHLLSDLGLRFTSYANGGIVSLAPSIPPSSAFNIREDPERTERGMAR